MSQLNSLTPQREFKNNSPYESPVRRPRFRPVGGGSTENQKTKPPARDTVGEDADLRIGTFDLVQLAVDSDFARSRATF